MLVIGLLAGFVGGFLVGQRMALPLPVRAADVPRSEQRSPDTQSGTVTQAPLAQTPAPVIESTPVQMPEVPTAGIVSALPDEPAQPVPAAPAGPSPRAPAQPAPREPVRRAAAAPAMLELASRPSGAVVWVDEVRVGVTPVTINDVTPGTRRVRMELPPHRPWTTTVDVQEGAHLRIGASLE
jgi:hypothetical protein